VGRQRWNVRNALLGRPHLARGELGTRAPVAAARGDRICTRTSRIKIGVRWRRARLTLRAACSSGLPHDRPARLGPWTLHPPRARFGGRPGGRDDSSSSVPGARASSHVWRRCRRRPCSSTETAAPWATVRRRGGRRAGPPLSVHSRAGSPARRRPPCFLRRARDWSRCRRTPIAEGKAARYAGAAGERCRFSIVAPEFPNSTLTLHGA
jgi:hypothetical protein